MLYYSFIKRKINQDPISGEGRYFNLIPYNPKRFFGNWNFEFYKTYHFEDIVTLDSPEKIPVQFDILKSKIRQLSQKLNRKIHLVIMAVGSGSVVDSISQHLDFLEEFIAEITLTDLKEQDLKRWDSIKAAGIKIGQKIGNILESKFVETLSGDLFYANELLGDIPNRFVYKDKGKLYDIRIKIFSPNRLPELIEKTVKKIVKDIYYNHKFPEIFTPEIGKLFGFDIVYRRRIFNREIEYYFNRYPDKATFAVADEAIILISNLYERLNKKGLILLNDYGFFSFENLHLIENFMRSDNSKNNFVRNYYGEFTTDPALELFFFKLKAYVRKISIKKTVDVLAPILKLPREVINLDGPERDFTFFSELIKERFEFWGISENKALDVFIQKYLESIKSAFKENEWEDYLNISSVFASETVDEIQEVLEEKLSEDQKLTLKKILLGFFNDDDHRFLTIIIEK